jgi:NAD(P)-dependent dehydrogenase (short-subunit alcohol dehydrogenase family)
VQRFKRFDLRCRRNLMDLSGNTVLVTGDGSGIGLAIAKRFVDAGSRVIVCGRRASRLAEARGASRTGNPCGRRRWCLEPRKARHLDERFARIAASME